MKNKARSFRAAVCLLMILLLAGCGGARELNALSIVLGSGIDKSPEIPDGILLTAQVVKPSKIKSASEGSSGGASESGSSQEGKAYWNIQASGETFFDAARECTHETNNKLYFAHNEVVVIGKEVAASGIEKPLDSFLRQIEPRPTTVLLVSATTAADILDIKPQLDILPAINIAKLTESQEFTSKSKAANLVDYTNAMLSKTTSLVIPMVSVEEKASGKTVVVRNSAVFKRDRMVGELVGNENRGLLWVTGQFKTTALNIPYQGGKVGVEIKKAEGSLDVEVKDGKVIAKAKVKNEGIVVDNETSQKVGEPSKFADLEKLENDYIRQEVMNTFKKAQGMKTDIYGLGEMIHKKYPKRWKDMEEKWDEIFPTVQMEIEVESKLTATGLIADPAIPK